MQRRKHDFFWLGKSWSRWCLFSSILGIQLFFWVAQWFGRRPFTIAWQAGNVSIKNWNGSTIICLICWVLVLYNLLWCAAWWKTNGSPHGCCKVCNRVLWFCYNEGFPRNTQNPFPCPTLHPGACWCMSFCPIRFGRWCVSMICFRFRF